MHTPVDTELAFYQGANFFHTIRVYTDSAKTTLADLTGYTARMDIRANLTDSAVLLTLTTENSRITITGASGEIELNVTAADTAGVTMTKERETWVYDLEIVAPSGKVIQLIKGKVPAWREVTRSA